MVELGTNRWSTLGDEARVAFSGSVAASFYLWLYGMSA